MTDENHRPAATPATSADLMADVSKAAAAISTYLAYRHEREERARQWRAAGITFVVSLLISAYVTSDLTSQPLPPTPRQISMRCGYEL